MPNDTLDEIQARWKQHRWISSNSGSRAIGDIRTLIEMVRGRDGVVTAARAFIEGSFEAGERDPWRCASGELGEQLDEALAALDTPTEQEQKR